PRAGRPLAVRGPAGGGSRAERSYSIASADGEPVAITVERLDDGEVSPYLTGKLRAGDELAALASHQGGLLITPRRPSARPGLPIRPRRQVPLLFAHATPHPVGLMCPQRERQAFTPDPAPCANSLRLRQLCHGLAGR